MKKIFDKIEEADIQIHEYKEGKKLCGYELNTYTKGGLNQIIFVDLRDKSKKPKKAADFKELFLKRVESIDVDEEVETMRQDKAYKAAFTMREALDDVEEWKNNIVALAESL